MAIFMDSFQYYATAQIARKWLLFSSPATIITGNQFGGTMMRLGEASGSTNGDIRKYISQSATWSVSMSYRAYLNQDWTRHLISFLSGSTYQISIALDNDNKIKIYSGVPTHPASSGALTGGTLLTTLATVIDPNVWIQLEVKATFATSVGANEFQVRVTGPGIDETGTVATSANTNPAGTAWADRIQLVGVGSGSSVNRRGIDISSIYVDNDQAALLGNVRVAALTPNGNGNSSQWSGSDGNSTDNYLLVDEATPNDDTDYVSSSTNAQIDLYGMTNFPTTAASVLGVQFNAQSRKTDAADAFIEAAYRISATNYFDTAVMVGNAYHNIATGLTTSPATATAWTQAEIEAMEAGYRSSL